jgi:uncharacterized LabA/DUF88 family protein
MGVQPIIPRLMTFVDGENLVCRYQEMLDSGCAPRPGVAHERDVYVWNPTMTLRRHWQVVRTYYYASVVGSDTIVQNVRTTLRQTQFAADAFQSPFAWLYPVLYNKPKNSRKESIIDVQLVTDMLSHAYQDNVDVVMLFTGDGDFVAAVREVMSRGKQVYVASFSSGLNKDITNVGDRNILLDDLFFASGTPSSTASFTPDPYPILTIR